MKRVVSFGELLLRLSPLGHERLFQSPQLRTFFGGSEANVAASLAHFGVRSRYVTRLPANPLGDAALAAMRAEGVEVDAVVRGGSRLGIYFAESGSDLRQMRVVYDRAGSAFSEIDGEAIDWPCIFEGADWLHLSGITPALGAGPAAAAARAARAARAAGVRVSVDLNFRPTLWSGRDPAPLVSPLVEQCELLIGNPGALRSMLGIAVADSFDDARAMAIDTGQQLHRELGVRSVAVTRREVVSASEHGWSASFFDAANGDAIASRRYQVAVIDRVGGGDSFAAALIYGRLAGRTSRDALEFATAASALKLTIPGDFNRVTADEVERIVAAG